MHVHLADGIVTDIALIGGSTMVSVTAIALAIRAASRGDRSPAWTGTLAAFVFVAQAINVPLVPGATAHVMGASLLSLTAGPAHAIIAMSAVVVAQALMLADGGVTVLGINLLNLAIVPVLVVWGLLRLSGGVDARRLAVVAVGGTALGSAASATILSAMLIVGANAPVAATFGWLLGVQTLAGLAEGVLTAMAVSRLRRMAPSLLPRSIRLNAPRPFGAHSTRSAFAWAAIAVALALALVPLASEAPDALERLLGELTTSK